MFKNLNKVSIKSFFKKTPDGKTLKCTKNRQGVRRCQPVQTMGIKQLASQLAKAVEPVVHDAIKQRQEITKRLAKMSQDMIYLSDRVSYLESKEQISWGMSGRTNGQHITPSKFYGGQV